MIVSAYKTPDGKLFENKVDYITHLKKLARKRLNRKKLLKEKKYLSNGIKTATTFLELQNFINLNQKLFLIHFFKKYNRNLNELDKFKFHIHFKNFIISDLSIRNHHQNKIETHFGCKASIDIEVFNDLQSSVSVTDILEGYKLIFGGGGGGRCPGMTSSKYTYDVKFLFKDFSLPCINHLSEEIDSFLIHSFTNQNHLIYKTVYDFNKFILNHPKLAIKEKKALINFEEKVLPFLHHHISNDVITDVKKNILSLKLNDKIKTPKVLNIKTSKI